MCSTPSPKGDNNNEQQKYRINFSHIINKKTALKIFLPIVLLRALRSVIPPCLT